jgi:catechol 2,3-dioxygenase-like lactoylglutathione lyase family enzyme
VKLDHVQIMIPVGAEGEARRFYCGLLGLAEVEKPAELAVRGGLWLQVGANQVHLGTDPAGAHASRAHLGFAVDDLAAWRERLAGAGVQLTDGTQPAGMRRFELRDPFGNRIELLEHLR